METERLLVLASSRKRGGRCIAGLSLDGNGLIRPVSDHGDGALSSYDTQLSTAPNELDVVSFSHHGSEGDLAQPENVVVDGSAWTNEGPMDAAEALRLIEPHLHTGMPSSAIAATPCPRTSQTKAWTSRWPHRAHEP